MDDVEALPEGGPAGAARPVVAAHGQGEGLAIAAGLSHWVLTGRSWVVPWAAVLLLGLAGFGRRLALGMGYPEPEVELEILVAETGADAAIGRKLVALGGKLREVEPLGLAEAPSTRLLVHAARMIGAGVPPRAACHAAVIDALTDDVELAEALRELVALVF